MACGFHAGDPATMRRVCAGAAARGVAIGAQVSYRDLAGFGRRRIDYEPAELRDDVLYQLVALDGFARAAGARVRYLKPHGALYNTAAVDPGQAGAVVAAVRDYDATLPVLCQPGSELARAATDITVGDVVRAVGGALTTVRGLPTTNTTYHGAATGLRDVWVAVEEAIEGVVDHKTMAELSRLAGTTKPSPINN